MIRAAQVIILIPFGFGVAFGQSADTLSEFEVASIKPSPPPGPGPHPVPRARIPDPSLFVCDSCTLSDLVRGAYDIRPYQLSCPSRMESERFTVNAKVPRGTTREQLQIMQQNLLQARFKLAGHHESAEMQQFELVTAKGGPKLKRPLDRRRMWMIQCRAKLVHQRLTMMAFQCCPRRRQQEATILSNGHVAAHYTDWSMKELAAMLSNQLRQPVSRTALRELSDTPFKCRWSLVVQPRELLTVVSTLGIWSGEFKVVKRLRKRPVFEICRGSAPPVAALIPQNDYLGLYCSVRHQGRVQQDFTQRRNNGARQIEVAARSPGRTQIFFAVRYAA
jgi:uncharacterized protein (TIGR03435 family)